MFLLFIIPVSNIQVSFLHIKKKLATNHGTKAEDAFAALILVFKDADALQKLCHAVPGRDDVDGRLHPGTDQTARDADQPLLLVQKRPGQRRVDAAARLWQRLRRLSQLHLRQQQPHARDIRRDAFLSHNVKEG